MGNIFEEQAVSFTGIIDDYSPWPLWERGKPWDIDEKVARLCVENAEEYLEAEPEVITASDFMHFFETGDRSVYGAKHFRRRSALGSMLVAECAEAKGRFTKKILDMVWLICEESSWTPSFHNPGNNPLPDKENPTLELFTLETGSLLAYVLKIMRKAFDEISPLIAKRIEDELEERIIVPYLERDDFSWMGFDDEKWFLTNWTPWCYSNCLAVVMLAEKDKARRKKAVEKLMKGLGRFIFEYPDDGACKEGCGYWSRAAASVFDCLEILHTVTEGEIDIYKLPKLKNMGEYIFNCYTGSGYFVNFADAGARVIPEAELMYRYGERVGSTALKYMGNIYIDTFLKERYYVISQSPMRLIPTLFNYRRVKDDIVKLPSGTQKVYPDSEECMIRPTDGWFFAAKGGNNNEAHNHNDVGSFILYCNDKPVFIDTGPEEYCAKTFSDKRYEIWTMQSDYHNLPKINGISQKDGAEYKADGFVCRDGIFECEIQNAYPPDAGVRLWKRRICEENNSIFLAESFEFSKVSEYEIMFMTPAVPDMAAGKIILGECELVYNPKQLEARVEKIELEDLKLRTLWGRLYRIVFKNMQNTIADTVVFEIKNINK